METNESTVNVSTSKAIDVPRIEKELASMWKSADDGEGSNAESGVTRACALNLVVYASVTDDREQIDDMLDAVNQQHPGRTLVLLVDRESTESNLEAYVSTRCRVLGGSGKQVCGEQVTIEASGPAVNTAASAIEPLLVPDVPVFLWWKDIPHYEDKLFNRMSAVADRIVIDSRCFDNPHEDLKRLAKIIGSQNQSASVSDLNWGRLTSWRTLMASFWDVADYRPYLNSIDRIIVDYDPPDVALQEIAPKALLFVGWLASRLGWGFEGRSDHATKDLAAFDLNSGGRRIQVEFRPTERVGHGDGMLVSLTLLARDSSAEFQVKRSDDRERLETEAHIEGSRTVGRILSYEEKSEGQRLSRELGLLQRDVIYEAALIAATQFIG